ncbi:hypothetical protein EXN66_Car011874 [Channa argus]|uniref:Uncharacterized protein n=1 Tax=Channa argus TaxID=215402 RepID=A0A6G1Q1R6_CHAAH|nr:hypothetical protein EXN66_Car011874 [Channa argus]
MTSLCTARAAVMYRNFGVSELTRLMSAARPMGAERGGEQRQIVLQCSTAANSIGASPAQRVFIQHPLVNGLYSFPPSATSAGVVPDTLLSGLQCGVTGSIVQIVLAFTSRTVLLCSFLHKLLSLNMVAKFSVATIFVLAQEYSRISRSCYIWGVSISRMSRRCVRCVPTLNLMRISSHCSNDITEQISKLDWV